MKFMELVHSSCFPYLQAASALVAPHLPPIHPSLGLTLPSASG